MIDYNEDLGKIGKKLILVEPFYGYFLSQLNKRITKEVPTGAVGKNGINVDLMINPEFWDSLDTPEKKMGLLKHELLHVAFEHLTMGEEYEDKVLLNIACDVEINQYIEKSWLPTEDALLPSSFPELNLPLKAGSRTYYKLLQKDLGTGKSEALDNLHKQMTEQGSGHPFDHSSWKEFDGLSEAEKELIKKQVEYQLKEVYENNVGKEPGNIPGELKGIIEKLYEETPPVIDWKGYFRRFVSNSNKIYTRKSRRKLNKRYYENPGIKIKQKQNILAAIDTSGSVSDRDLQEFFAETKHMHKAGVAITIIECDTKIHKVYDYDPKKDITIHGRGGTSFHPVIDFYKENARKYDSLVYLTDGEAQAPEHPKKPILWLISSGRVKNENLPGLVIQMQHK
jgi:predicted metal-dependent peptidase